MKKAKIILDLCGGTGAWSQPYKNAGYDVRNITFPDYDVLTYKPPKNVYGILAAPPCTMFSRARSRSKTERDFKEGMEVVIACLKIIWACRYEPIYRKDGALRFWALENPNGFLTYFLGKPPYTFHPWYFGDMYRKKTCLWGWFNNPTQIFFLKPSSPKFTDMRIISDPQSWMKANIRTAKRSITPRGFAEEFFKTNR